MAELVNQDGNEDAGDPGEQVLDAAVQRVRPHEDADKPKHGERARRCRARAQIEWRVIGLHQEHGRTSGYFLWIAWVREMS